MVSLTNLVKIETYLEHLFSVHSIDPGRETDLPVMPFIGTIVGLVCKKFKLNVVSTDGTTRIVLKSPRSKTVIKIGLPWNNQAEYSLYKALENSSLGDLFAECIQISPKGYVLEMEYVSKPFPSAKGQYHWVNPNLNKIRNDLESHFSFITKYNTYNWGADFHDDNMRVDSHGDIKLIDYSSLLTDMFFRRKSTTVKSAIRGVLKLDFPKVKLNLYCRDRVIYYTNNTKLMKAEIDYDSKKAY